ncbi:MAG: hypothetical protein QMD46_13255 [Methanomicrobiales archaeon]|nr:hypothetical protein [Methanomicrobiales archaeon]
MPDLKDRIVLWRNTIQLFHRYNRPDFVGPFLEAGFHRYRIEPHLSSRHDGQEKHPDIVAVSDDGWVLLELTVNQHSKKEKLDSYKNIDPRSLSVYGFPVFPKAPDVISSRMSAVHDGDHCQILVKDVLRISNDCFIGNLKLRESLVKRDGSDLSKLPDIPVTLLPEMQAFEIRRGLIDIVMQLFKENHEGKTAHEMVKEGLERLYDIIGQSEKQALRDKVIHEMDVLMNKYLKGYIGLKDGKYRATEKFKQHPRTLLNIAMSLQEWANPTQRTLSDFRK